MARIGCSSAYNGANPFISASNCRWNGDRSVSGMSWMTARRRLIASGSIGDPPGWRGLPRDPARC